MRAAFLSFLLACLLCLLRTAAEVKDFWFVRYVGAKSVQIVPFLVQRLLRWQVQCLFAHAPLMHNYAQNSRVALL